MRKLKIEELGRISVEEYKRAEKLPVTIVLDNIRSLNNIGSIFRTADGFRVEKIHLCGITAIPPHREIHKTALGATESVNWEYFKETLDSIEQLKLDGYKILSLEQTDNSTPLNEFFPQSNQKYALILGNEVKGVDDSVIGKSDRCLEILQLGTKHSFNVTISAGIAIYDIALKLNYLNLV
jgi:tRNA G18 (ribose-2'-O)-methylase SpoU